MKSRVRKYHKIIRRNPKLEKPANRIVIQLVQYKKKGN
jgi:hypothetical protein